MYVPKHFEAADVVWCHDLMRREPFAILVGTDQAGVPFATHLPVLLDETPTPYGRLLAHVARPNPQWQMFAPDRPVLVVFPGAHTYVSPSWYGQHPSVPTWNYVAVHAYGVPRVIEEPGEVRALLDRRQGSLAPEEQAAALLARILLGEDPRTSAALQALADVLLGHLPPNREPSVALWHFGTWAMFQVGGERWRRWNAAMTDAIVRSQRPAGAGDLAGSWPLAGEGVGDQAKLAMCLEVYYRYDRVFGVK